MIRLRDQHNIKYTWISILLCVCIYIYTQNSIDLIGRFKFNMSTLKFLDSIAKNQKLNQDIIFTENWCPSQNKNLQQRCSYWQALSYSASSTNVDIAAEYWKHVTNAKYWLLSFAQSTNNWFYYMIAVRIFPEDSQIWYLLGKAYRHSGKLAKAEEALRYSLNYYNPDSLLEQFGTKCNILEEYGRTLFQQYLHDTSIKIARSLINQCPNNSSGYFLYGATEYIIVANNLLSRFPGTDFSYDSSITMLKQSLKYKPTPETYLYLGRVYAKNGNVQLALSAFEKSVAMYPTDPVVRWDLSNLFMQIHQYNQAVIHRKKAIEFTPHAQIFAYRWIGLGDALLATGNVVEAEDAYRFGCQLDATFSICQQIRNN